MGVNCYSQRPTWRLEANYDMYGVEYDCRGSICRLRIYEFYGLIP